MQLKLVRVTHRVCEAYYARIYLSKVSHDCMATATVQCPRYCAVRMLSRVGQQCTVTASLFD